MLTRLRIWILTLCGLDPRGLFHFWDGRRWRTVDPLEALRAFFQLSSFDWDETPQLLRSHSAPVQLEAFRVIAIAVREVFRLPQPAAGGLTEQGCLDLLTSFRLFLGDVKKNGSLFPISPDSTDSPSSVDLPIPAKPGSVSTSMPTAPSPAPPGSPAAPTPAD